MPRTLTSALMAAGLFLSAARAFAVTTGDVWNEVFTADEQRILYAIRADPTADAALKADLRKVVSASPQALEAEKRKFQAEWLGRIQTFSQSYRPGQGQGGTKLSISDARAKVPWLAEIDNRDWGGQIFPLVRNKMDAYEFGYNIAFMQSLDAAGRAELIKRLADAKGNIFATPARVSDAMVDSGRETMGKVLAGVASDLPARVATARQQLEAAQRLLAGSPAAQNPSVVFDGARPRTGSVPTAPGETNVVDARTGPPGPTGAPGTLLAGPGGAVTAPPVGRSGPVTSAPPPPAMDNGEVPPPRTPAQGEKTYASKPSAGASSGFGSVLKSPMVLGGAGGAVLGGLLGFLFGGPIGALIGAAIGAAVGAGGMYAATHMGGSKTPPAPAPADAG